MPFNRIILSKPKSVHSLLILAFLLVVFSNSSEAQNTLKGRVIEYSTETPIPYASIFLTNTTLGITADEQGEFTLSIPDGSYNVLVRMLGYEPLTFSINTNRLPKKGFQVQLNSEDQELEEIDVEEERDPIWYRNLELFKKYFLGTSKNGQSVQIENEKDLLLDRESHPDILQVSAKNPIQLDNPNLGYHVEFLLVDFEYDFKKETILYKGYPLFIPYEDVKRAKAKKFQKNRGLAYRGSLQHLIHCLYLGVSEEEGYVLQKMKSIPNPDKPSPAIMEEARSLVKSSTSTALKDSIQVHVLSKSTLPDSILVLQQQALDPESLLDREKEEGRVFLNFSDHIHITYTKEPMAREYPGAPIGSYRKSNQISKIKLNDPRVELFASGSFDDPLGIMVEGYMAWERVGDLMPIDFVPTDEK